MIKADKFRQEALDVVAEQYALALVEMNDCDISVEHREIAAGMVKAYAQAFITLHRELYPTYNADRKTRGFYIVDKRMYENEDTPMVTLTAAQLVSMAMAATDGKMGADAQVHIVDFQKHVTAYLISPEGNGRPSQVFHDKSVV